MSWFLLLLAGLFEVAWAVGLKYSGGLSKPWVSAVTVVAMLVSLWLLALALRELPLAVAYGVWVGIGALGSALAGTLLFGEAPSALRIFSIGLLLCGVAGLKLSAGR